MIYSPGRSLHSRDNLKFGIDYCSFKQIGRKRLLLSPSILKFWVRNISTSNVFLFIIRSCGLYRILCALMWTEHNQTENKLLKLKVNMRGSYIDSSLDDFGSFLGSLRQLGSFESQKILFLFPVWQGYCKLWPDGSLTPWWRAFLVIWKGLWNSVVVATSTSVFPVWWSNRVDAVVLLLLCWRFHGCKFFRVPTNSETTYRLEKIQKNA